MCWIWFEPYAFFRKFVDGVTIFLNGVLLFLVLVLPALTVPIEWIWTAGGRRCFLQRAAIRVRASFIDCSAPVNSSRDRQVQKRR